MRDGIEMLGSDRRKNHKLYAFVCPVGIADIVGAAVNRHIVATSGKPRGKFFCESLESTVVGRNAASPQDGQFHRVRIIV